MDAWIERAVRQVQTVPPACLSGFRVTPTHAEPWDDWAGWALGCPCGAAKGKVLGFPLKDCDPQYDGPDQFVSPLAFACSACGRTTEIIDTGSHGYNAEISKDANEGSDSNVRGSGERQAIPCPHCRATQFSVTAVCSHPHFDLIEDEPELEPRAQDCFDAFVCRGTCSSCGQESNLASFELA